MSRILVIDDDESICRSLEIHFKAKGHHVATALTGEGGIQAARDFDPDVTFLDLQLPDTDGLKVLSALIEEAPDRSVVMITGKQDMQATIKAIQTGATDYIRKPLDLDDLLLSIEKIEGRKARNRSKTDHLFRIHEHGDQPREIVGADRKIIECIKQIGVLSSSPVTVLIEGETGTGKELVARAIHESSGGDKPFIAVNCSAIVSTLWESELFGHERGAFTGADRLKPGKLELAADGTVFLDEIGDIPLDLQSKLLRVLQEREFERVGGTGTLAFKARVIAATHRDLDAMVREGTFRADLMHRLAVGRISLPPLRERVGDIQLLVDHLVGKVNRILHREITGVSESVIRRLESYDWPGNVRELENVLMRSIVRERGEILQDVAMDDDLRPERIERKPGEVKTLKEAEKEHIRTALGAHGWNITHTAKSLEISPTTLRKKIADFDLRSD